MGALLLQGVVGGAVAAQDEEFGVCCSTGNPGVIKIATEIKTPALQEQLEPEQRGAALENEQLGALVRARSSVFVEITHGR